MYRPSSSLSAPVTRFDGRPRARDRPKPRRRPRPKEPEEARRSRSAPATGAPTTPQPPSHTAQNEGFLYRKKVTTSDLEGQQRSPNRYNIPDITDGWMMDTYLEHKHTHAHVWHLFIYSIVIKTDPRVWCCWGALEQGGDLFRGGPAFTHVQLG